jgi:D-alanine-D-alanine ligase
VLGSAVGMDKITMKAVFQANGLPVVRYLALTRSRWDGERDAVLDEIQQQLTFPLYVKPANLGSSVGITRANDRDSLASALDVAAAYDRRLLVEESVEGATEINCSVLGNDDPIASVCEEPIRWQDAALLSYDQKYLGGGKSSPESGMASAKRRIPAPISPEETETIQRLAVAAFKAVDCAGIARLDFLLDRSSGAVYVNEINTMPGSLSFYLWEPSGIPFPKLVDRLVELARERQRDRRRNIRSYDSKLLEQFGRGAKGANGGR